MPDPIRFFVAGIPAPGGSKKGFVVDGHVNIVEDCRRTPSWRRKIVKQAARFFAAPLEGPLAFSFEFRMPRPKGHLGTGRNSGQVKASSPKHHTVKPDTTKLVRAAEDSLKGIAWGDDSQVIRQKASKVYSARPGLMITIEQVETP